MTTPFSKKCEIITVFTDEFEGEDWTKDFFDFYNLGIPFAVGVADNLITLGDRGIEYVNDAWDGLLKLLGIDPFAEFDSYNEMMEIANESWK